MSIASLEVHTLRRSEAIALARIWNAAYPGNQIAADRLADKVGRRIERGGRAWLLRSVTVIAGYGSVMPTPGLAGLYEVDGFIDPALRRRGLARYFLRSMINDLAGSDARQLYYPLSSADSPAARFFAAQGFYPEHEERYLSRDVLDDRPRTRFSAGFGLQTFDYLEAITWFRRLYQAIFNGLPWYQPYGSDLEVADDLADAGDLLFLEHGRTPVGFLWLRWPEVDVAEIEPVGLLPQYQGRGLGRQLLLAGLDRAAQQGGRRVKMGAWSQNEAALGLYEQVGFRETSRRLFVAYDLTSHEQRPAGQGLIGLN